MIILLNNDANEYNYKWYLSGFASIFNEYIDELC